MTTEQIKELLEERIYEENGKQCIDIAVIEHVFSQDRLSNSVYFVYSKNSKNKVLDLQAELKGGKALIKQGWKLKDTIKADAFLQVYYSKTLKEKFEEIANEYLEIFCKKQDIDIDKCYWIADDIGSIVDYAGEYYFSYNDIRLDIDLKQRKRAIFNWHNENLEAYYEKKEAINYYSYCKGLRQKDIK